MVGGMEGRLTTGRGSCWFRSHLACPSLVAAVAAPLVCLLVCMRLWVLLQLGSITLICGRRRQQRGGAQQVGGG